MNLFAAELLKLRTTRVPYVMLAIIALLGAIAAAGLVGSGALADDSERAVSLAQGASFSGILALVLGILIVTNEYRHGTVNSTFLLEPRRVRVLLAKVAAAAVTGLAIAAASLIAALAVAVPWSELRGDPSPLSDDIGKAAVLLALVYILYCLLGAGLGAVIQNQVGAIVVALVWFFIGESVISVVTGLLTNGIGEPDPVTPYLPGSALGGILGFSQGEGSDEFLLGPWASAGLASVYVAAIAALGALAMTRRDPS